MCSSKKSTATTFCSGGNTQKKGAPTELMPTIMDAFDACIKYSNNNNKDRFATARKPKKKTFNHLSPCVQKILSNVLCEDEDSIEENEIVEEVKKNFAKSDDILNPNRFISNAKHRSMYRSMRLPTPSSVEKQSLRHAESMEHLISPNVQKMISNFPETDLVVITEQKKGNNHNSSSFLHSNCGSRNKITNSELSLNGKTEENSIKNEKNEEEKDDLFTTTLNNNTGGYLHTGFASRRPVGRTQNNGNILSVTSECSFGNFSSATSSSEVSRPVSMTSLGSCSSSGGESLGGCSGGGGISGSVGGEIGAGEINGNTDLNSYSSSLMPASSDYLASVESLDSDQEPSGSQDSGIAEPSNKSPEMRVLQEVIDTEAVYVADLREIIEGYLRPWESNCPFSEHLPQLFNNIEQIYEFNKTFLGQIREADCNPTKIANVFIRNDSGFSVYNDYCTKYPRTMEVLAELTRNKEYENEFRVKQVSLKHSLPLGSYLLKPVQRILKYHLLLSKLAKQCDNSHKTSVDLALTTMTSVATNINDMKRKHEHCVRVHEIQSQLNGWHGADLTTFGELVAEGVFRVSGARGRRHVVLFDRMLMMAKGKSGGALTHKSHIMSSNLMLVEQVRGEPLSFQVLPFDNPRLQCTLRAKNIQHKRDWTLQIKRVILENYNVNIPNHARQLVMQLGQDFNQNEESISEKWSPLNKTSSTPHYLERRSRFRNSSSTYFHRAQSQERSNFFALNSTRRKSEPEMVVPQYYNTKTVPKKISKIKKAKESSATKFYTNLFEDNSTDTSFNINDGSCVNGEDGEKNAEDSANNLVILELLENGENPEGASSINLNAGSRNSAPIIWQNQKISEKLPNRADSLPRSFQLNESAENGVKLDVEDKFDEQLENNSTTPCSRLEDPDFPINKIYRKSAIRMSLVQRIRALVSEDDSQQQQQLSEIKKYPNHKLGSKSMGEKIAHPDYVDPQKLFPVCAESNTESVELSFEINALDHNVLNHRQSVSSSSLQKQLDEISVVEKSTGGNLMKKQPANPPPPVPLKPAHLVRKNNLIDVNCTNRPVNEVVVESKSWVKTIVGRFE